MTEIGYIYKNLEKIKKIITIYEENFTNLETIK